MASELSPELKKRWPMMGPLEPITPETIRGLLDHPDVKFTEEEHQALVRWLDKQPSPPASKKA